MDPFLSISIGLAAGLIGGLLGIGGSTLIIPALVIALSHTDAGYQGHQQHLLQAAAMICNFFVAAPSVITHHRAGAIDRRIVTWLVGPALIGILAGVALSNTPLFAKANGRFLAMGLALFMLYVAAYNLKRLLKPTQAKKSSDPPEQHAIAKIVAVGLPTGLIAGLLGIGGGALCVPAQQIFLRLPLRQAIANSAATITIIALCGATYKNATLSHHDLSIIDALHLAALLIPAAVAGSLIGSRLTHLLPRRVIRAIFCVFMTLMAARLFYDAVHATG